MEPVSTTRRSISRVAAAESALEMVPAGEGKGGGGVLTIGNQAEGRRKRGEEQGRGGRNPTAASKEQPARRRHLSDAPPEARLPDELHLRAAAAALSRPQAYLAVTIRPSPADLSSRPSPAPTLRIPRPTTHFMGRSANPPTL